jgi:hypothetical protein
MVMSKAQSLVMLGFAVIVVGILLLISPSLSGEGGFVFIFPFFFGSVNPLLALVIGFAFFFAVLLMMRSTLTKTEGMAPYQGGSSRLFMPITGRCPMCGGPLPENASFCPHCGSPMDTERP